MQKTFDVFVKESDDRFLVCSKRVKMSEGIIKIDSKSEIINDGAEIRSCDVSHWLEKLGLDENEVIEGQITFKFKNK